MNRSLIIVMCDFLLVSLLALASFDQMGDGEFGQERGSENSQAPYAESVRAEMDLIEALAFSLEAEQASRESIESDFQAEQANRETLREALDTEQANREAIERELEEARLRIEEGEGTLSERERMLESLREDLEAREAESRRLEEERLAIQSRYEEARQTAEEMTKRYTETAEEATMTQFRLRALEDELDGKISQLGQVEQNLAELEERRAIADRENRALSASLEVSEAEKALVRQNLEAIQSEISVVREEKTRVQEHATQLAQGVTSLAERSGELSREIRRSQPRSPNSIFSEFLSNRIDLSFQGNRNVFIGSGDRSNQSRTILIRDGEQVYALFHVEDSLLNIYNPATTWNRLSGMLEREGVRMSVSSLSFLSADPRIVITPVGAETVDRLGAKVYDLALEPFQFPEVVLVDGGGTFYGESTFRLNPDNARYVQMETRMFSRLFGEFSPSGGDLVFSKTDELIGIMVNNEYCLLLNNFLAAETITLGSNFSSANTRDVLNRMRGRLENIPFRIRQ